MTAGIPVPVCPDDWPRKLSVSITVTGSTVGFWLPSGPVTIEWDSFADKWVGSYEATVGGVTDTRFVTLERSAPFILLGTNLDTLHLHSQTGVSCTEPTATFAWSAGASAVDALVGPYALDGVPYNPGGYTMDYLRSCYTVDSRVCQDSELARRKRWFFVDDASPCFPSWHSTAALSWSLDNYLGASDSGIGEQQYGNAWSNGLRPARATAGRFYGAVADFQEGCPEAAIGSVPVDADGIPVS